MPPLRYYEQPGIKGMTSLRNPIGYAISHGLREDKQGDIEDCGRSGKDASNTRSTD